MDGDTRLVWFVDAAELMDADVVDGVRCAVVRRKVIWSEAHIVLRLVLEQRTRDDGDPSRARDRGRCRGQGCLSCFANAPRAVCRSRCVRVGNGVVAGTLARVEIQSAGSESGLNKGHSTTAQSGDRTAPPIVRLFAIQATLWKHGDAKTASPMYVFSPCGDRA